MPKQAVIRSFQDLQKDALELVSNWVIVEPDTPSDVLAERVVAEAPGELLDPLGRILLAQYFTKLLRAARAQQRGPKPKAAPLFPEWDALPARIITPEGRVPLKKANVTQLRAYLKVLQERQIEAMEGSRIQKRIEQVGALIELMREHARTKHGITAAEVAAIA